jgi:hypothetical protein
VWARLAAGRIEQDVTMTRSPRKPSQDPRRACLAVCGGLVLFVLVQVGLRLWIDTRAGWLRDPEYAARLARLRSRAPRGAERPLLVVMFGSSRTQYGLNGLQLQADLSRELGRPVRVHNLGRSASGGVEALFNWRRLDRDGVRPELVLLEVPPLLLNANYPNHELSAVHHPTEELVWADLALVERYESWARYQVRDEWRMGQAVPVLGHRRCLLRLLAPWALDDSQRKDPARGMNAAGELPVHEPWRGVRQTPERLAQVRASHAPALKDFRLGGPSCDALREVLTECRARGLPTALVLMPEGPTYRSWFPESVYDETRAWMRLLRQEHGCALVDAREWIGENGFIDSHHMKPEGGLAFTERLGREAVLPLMRAHLEAEQRLGSSRP